MNDRLTFGRQIGFQVFGDLYDKRFSYAVGLFNGNSVNTTANDNDEMSPYGRVSAQVFRGPLGKEGTLSLGIGAYSSEDLNVSIGGLGFDSTPATADRDNLLRRQTRRPRIRPSAQGAGRPLRDLGGAHRRPFRAAQCPPAGRARRRRLVAPGVLFRGGRALRDRAAARDLRPSTAVDNNETDIETLGLNYFFKGHDVKAMVNVLQVDDQLQADTQTRVLARLQVIF